MCCDLLLNALSKFVLRMLFTQIFWEAQSRVLVCGRFFTWRVSVWVWFIILLSQKSFHAYNHESETRGKMLTTSRVILEAPQLWRHLNNGIINVYKPAGVSQRQVQTRIIANLCRGELIQWFLVCLHKYLKYFRLECNAREATSRHGQDWSCSR